MGIKWVKKKMNWRRRKRRQTTGGRIACHQIRCINQQKNRVEVCENRKMKEKRDMKGENGYKKEKRAKKGYKWKE